MCKNSATGLCSVIFLAVATTVPAQSFNVIRTFPGYPAPYPFGRLVCSGDTLFGTTMGGGARGYGSVFCVKTDGTSYTTLKSFSVGSNGFDFHVTGYSNQMVAVEACSDPAATSWICLETNTINGPVSFADPAWANYPRRFYRLRAH